MSKVPPTFYIKSILENALSELLFFQVSKVKEHLVYISLHNR